ncbi:MAG: methionyl-tRNA formyltransferase [Nitrospiraceae bacterium]|nr:MAG: methionyl-tRNA formyltransferase [Nitrospiraceae bacterium]
MNIVFFGTPEFAVPPLGTLLNSEHKVLAVITQPDRPGGRGRHVSACPVKVEAGKAGLKIFQPLKVRDAGFIAELKRIAPDAIVVAAYGQILPSAIIRLPELGCINIHASLLPKYRGAAPINWAIINGEKKTGITTMLMDEGMDTGAVLLQEETEIAPDDTAGALSHRLSETGASLLIRTLEGIENGSVRPVPQSDGATYAPLLKKTDGFIQWGKSASDVSNLIRGMNPWPGAYGFLEGERVNILKAEPVEGNGEPGIIYRVSKEELAAGTGKGLLSVLEIQPAGKPVMTIRAFLQGRRIKEGMRFITDV